MEHDILRYVRHVVALHVLLLLAILGITAYAGYEIYDTARAQVIENAKREQGLLALQTASGIQAYFDSIVSDLDLVRQIRDEQGLSPFRPGGQLEPMRRDQLRGRLLPGGRLGGPRDGPPPDGGPAGPPRIGPEANLSPQIQQLRLRLIGPGLWRQLSSRVQDLLVYHTDTGLFFSFSDDPLQLPANLPTELTHWLDNVRGPSVSGLVQFGDKAVAVVAIPVDPNSPQVSTARGADIEQGTSPQALLVAIVPINALYERFIASLNRGPGVSAMLLDQNSTVMASSMPALIGQSFRADADSSVVRNLSEKYISLKQQGQEVVDHTFSLMGQSFPPSVLALHPVDIAGQTWWVSVSASMSRLDGTVTDVISRLLWSAAAIIILMTGVLVSTAIVMIRGRNRVERMRTEVIDRELGQARQIQLHWLPSEPPEAGHVQVHAVNEPASHISGDFYNWFDLPDGRTVLAIGDVTGHGMSAAFLMSTTQLLIKTTMQNTADPATALEEVNRLLCSQVFNGQFVTLMLAVLDPETNTMELASAGHPPPLVSDDQANRFVALPIEPQLVLGVEADMSYTSQHLTLPGHLLLMYTDGVIELKNDVDERYSLEQFAEDLGPPPQTTDDLAAAVRSAVDNFRGTAVAEDDLTYVAVGFAATSKPPSPADLAEING